MVLIKKSIAIGSYKHSYLPLALNFISSEGKRYFFCGDVEWGTYNYHLLKSPAIGFEFKIDTDREKALTLTEINLTKRDRKTKELIEDYRFQGLGSSIMRKLAHKATLLGFDFKITMILNPDIIRISSYIFPKAKVLYWDKSGHKHICSINYYQKTYLRNNKLKYPCEVYVKNNFR